MAPISVFRRLMLQGRNKVFCFPSIEILQAASKFWLGITKSFSVNISKVILISRGVNINCNTVITTVLFD